MLPPPWGKLCPKHGFPWGIQGNPGATRERATQAVTRIEWRRGRDSNSRCRFQHNCLAGSPVQPLQHLSVESGGTGDSFYETAAQGSIEGPESTRIVVSSSSRKVSSCSFSIIAGSPREVRTLAPPALPPTVAPIAAPLFPPKTAPRRAPRPAATPTVLASFFLLLAASIVILLVASS